MEADSDLLSQSSAAELSAPRRTVFVSADQDGEQYAEMVRRAFLGTPGRRNRDWQLITYPSYDLWGETNNRFGVALEDVESAVVVLSPGYISAQQTIQIEYPAIGRLEEKDRLPVFRVLAIDVPPSEANSIDLDRHPLFNAKPLADMDESERQDALAALVTAVGRAVDRRRGVAGTDVRQQQQQVSDAAQSSTVDAVTRTKGVLDKFRSHQDLDPVGYIVYRGSEYAGAASPPMPVTTDLLLLAFAEDGVDVPEHENWTSAWLSRRLGKSARDELRARCFTMFSITLPAAIRVTDASLGVALAAEAAEEIAKRTTGNGEIHARHLLAALLTDRRGVDRSGVLQQLRRAGLDIEELRREFFDVVRGRGDDDAAWSLILLGRELRVYRMAGFHADDTRGEDLLGIQQDVLAFAMLIAARTVTPPLSIGLFGEWGSGKSFFMRHLRKAVEGLAAEASRSGRMQREVPFYKRIVQIEFNAWHYVEGNLWASLVEHIFRNLHVPGETASQALQKRLMDDLRFTEQARAEADAERRRAQAEAEEAQRQVDAARQEHERQRAELARQAAKEAEKELARDAVWSAVRPVLERLGIDRTGDSAQDALEALAEARAVVGRAGRVLLPLVQAPPEERRRRTRLLLLALFLGPVVYWVVGVAVNALGDAALAQLTAVATGIGTLLTAGAAWVRSQAKWASERVAEVEQASRRVDRLRAEKEAELTRTLRELELRLELARADYEAALRRQAEADTRVREAEAKLDEASVAKLLASFIQDRAASTDYRKHLGVLALVRNDFETLSGLIEEENWHLSPDGADDGRYPGKTRFATPEQEGVNAASRINRIVLYIDDLDRCPPKKVVEVLQAVHLLLAFPLFVVVVGVDARWIKQSLQVRYRELLDEGGGLPAGGSLSSEELLIGRATTDDYLEKIFQIPFWLRPMDEARTADMVRGLLAGSVVAAPPSTDPTVDSTPPPATPSPASDQAPPPPADADAAARPVAVRVDAIVREPEVAAPAVEPQVNLESLEFRPEELDFMAGLAPLLDRSPRALKRFVNVYRLVKAGLTREEQRTFYDTGEQSPPPYQAVLFLLAVDTGFPPAVAGEFFDALYPPTTGNPPTTLLGIVDVSSNPMTMGSRPSRWSQLLDWTFGRGDGGTQFDAPLALLVAWEPRVTRFSFRTAA